MNKKNNKPELDKSTSCLKEKFDKVVANDNMLNQILAIPNLKDCITDFIYKSNLSNSQIRRWYELIIKLIEQIHLAQQNAQLKYTALRILAKIQYDVNRNIRDKQYINKTTKKVEKKRPAWLIKKEIEKTLIKTIQILYQLLMDNRPLDNYLKQLETFWMLIIAYSK